MLKTQFSQANKYFIFISWISIHSSCKHTQQKVVSIWLTAVRADNKIKVFDLHTGRKSSDYKKQEGNGSLVTPRNCLHSTSQMSGLSHWQWEIEQVKWKTLMSISETINYEKIWIRHFLAFTSFFTGQHFWQIMTVNIYENTENMKRLTIWFHINYVAMSHSNKTWTNALHIYFNTPFCCIYHPVKGNNER